MSKVFCFGELLLRLSPELGGEWIKQASMPVYVGGAELNAATALSKWGVPVAYCTALPENSISSEICTDLKGKNIDVSPIVYSGNRIGCYYLPQGADLKHSGVIYDRAHSAFSELHTGKIDWDKVLNNVSWFHFSAICPALNENVALVCKEALEAANKKGITISVDLNHRAKLWQYGKKCSEVMPDLVQYCDLVMGNIWAADKMLEIKVPEDILDNKSAYLEHARLTSVEILKRFEKCKQVANTFRFDVSGGINYYATLYINDKLFVSNEYNTQTIVDKVGSGDCFMAGLIYGNYNNLIPQEIIDFSTAAAFNKLFIKGDATTSSVEQIKKSYLHYA
jgi:2-dehydro-3-deoxygluconokinase